MNEIETDKISLKIWAHNFEKNPKFDILPPPEFSGVIAENRELLLEAISNILLIRLEWILNEIQLKKFERQNGFIHVRNVW